MSLKVVSEYQRKLWESDNCYFVYAAQGVRQLSCISVAYQGNNCVWFSVIRSVLYIFHAFLLP